MRFAKSHSALRLVSVGCFFYGAVVECFADHDRFTILAVHVDFVVRLIYFDDVMDYERRVSDPSERVSVLLLVFVHFTCVPVLDLEFHSG